MKATKTKSSKKTRKPDQLTPTEKKQIKKESSYAEQTPEPPQIMNPSSHEERENKKNASK